MVATLNRKDQYTEHFSQMLDEVVSRRLPLQDTITIELLDYEGHENGIDPAALSNIEPSDEIRYAQLSKPSCGSSFVVYFDPQTATYGLGRLDELFSVCIRLTPQQLVEFWSWSDDVAERLHKMELTFSELLAA
jgi:hypothetical protein